MRPKLGEARSVPRRLPLTSTTYNVIKSPIEAQIQREYHDPRARGMGVSRLSELDVKYGLHGRREGAASLSYRRRDALVLFSRIFMLRAAPGSSGLPILSVK
ncbi:MAG TPA: hypothetical protein VMW38_08210 [Terriglobia bacterium]|nr:hypothetical protein [Terriglobia bacterium]